MEERGGKWETGISAVSLLLPAHAGVRQEEGEGEALGPSLEPASPEGQIPSREVQDTRLSQHPSRGDIPASWRQKAKHGITSWPQNPVQSEVIGGETEAREA